MQQVVVIDEAKYPSIEIARKAGETIEFEINNEFIDDYGPDRYGAFYIDIIDNLEMTIQALSGALSISKPKAFVWVKERGFIEACIQNFPSE